MVPGENEEPHENAEIWLAKQNQIIEGTGKQEDFCASITSAQQCNGALPQHTCCWTAEKEECIIYDAEECPEQVITQPVIGSQTAPSPSLLKVPLAPQKLLPQMEHLPQPLKHKVRQLSYQMPRL